MKKIVKATPEFWEDIRIIRNETKAGFLTQHEITKEEHLKFMFEHYRDYFVFVVDNLVLGFAGVVDGDIRVAVSGINRGLGVAFQLINKISEIYPHAEARIKFDNGASLALFLKCGYEFDRIEESKGYQLRVLKKPLRLPHDSFEIVDMFEKNLSAYTGAPYVITTNSCTSAILLCCSFWKVEETTIPKKTYLSVPQSILHAGGTLRFEDVEWEGIYQLKPYPIYDSAKRFSSRMYIPKTMMCLSFHQKKILNIGKGGAILLDDLSAYNWFKKMRYEGRTSGLNYDVDNINMLGYNFYMDPERAARGLCLMQHLPKTNSDQIEEGGYRDLTEFGLFKDVEIINGED